MVLPSTLGLATHTSWFDVLELDAELGGTMIVPSWLAVEEAGVVPKLSWRWCLVGLWWVPSWPVMEGAVRAVLAPS